MGDAEERPKKRRAGGPKASVACFACRRRRIRCSGTTPSCSYCLTQDADCVYALDGDKRKPFSKDYVNALLLQVATLQEEVKSLKEAQARMSATEDEGGVVLDEGPSSDDRATPIDAVAGGLALNMDGELRFFGPTSSYRAILGEAFRDHRDEPEDARVASLSRAPLPGAATWEPTPPRRPPDLEIPEMERLLELALTYGVPLCRIIPDVEFLRDWRAAPLTRTQYYSPFLLYTLLGLGSRYLDGQDPLENNIILKIDAPSRVELGDVFVEWARHLVEQEILHPTLSTIRALNVLGIYLAGRGLDETSWLYMGLSTRLAEDFGLHLGMHRYRPVNGRSLPEELVANRRDAFWGVVGVDIIAAISIGRQPSYRVELVDTELPSIDHDLEFSSPRFRSSSFHWAARLLKLASRVMNEIYATSTAVSFTTRRAAVAELNTELEKWANELPGYLRANRQRVADVPDVHVLVLNMVHLMLVIQLHRPFLRRYQHATTSNAKPLETTSNLSTIKCLGAAKDIVRIMKQQKTAHGIARVCVPFHHAAFSAGTILALSATEDGISPTPTEDQLRRRTACEDFQFVLSSLREIGERTYPAAGKSADVLYAFAVRWSLPLRSSQAGTPLDSRPRPVEWAELASLLLNVGNETEDLSTLLAWQPLQWDESATPFMFPSFSTETWLAYGDACSENVGSMTQAVSTTQPLSMTDEFSF